jgi:metal-responsive CopG/Arc/MetJ family transcriptional regulator
MPFSLPIGIVLPQPLLERLDKIARFNRVSRSTVARSVLIRGLTEYEQGRNAGHSFEVDAAVLSRSWRPRASKTAP